MQLIKKYWIYFPALACTWQTRVRTAKIVVFRKPDLIGVPLLIAFCNLL